MGFWLLGFLPGFQPPIKSGANSGSGLKCATKYPEPGLEPEISFFFLDGLLATEFPTSFSASIKAAANLGWGLKFAKSTWGQACSPKFPFFWMGFWLLGSLPGFQHPINAGANLG